MLASRGSADDLTVEDFLIRALRRPVARLDLVVFDRPDQKDMGTAAIDALIADDV
jgi:hypothetical protein